MAVNELEITLQRDTITNALEEILKDMTCDWDSAFAGKIGPETFLIADLGFGSIDVVQLIVSIEERFHRRDFPLQELLMQDGRYVEELQVGQVVDFLVRHGARA